MFEVSKEVMDGCLKMLVPRKNNKGWRKKALANQEAGTSQEEEISLMVEVLRDEGILLVCCLQEAVKQPNKSAEKSQVGL